MPVSQVVNLASPGSRRSPRPARNRRLARCRRHRPASRSIATPDGERDRSAVAAKPRTHRGRRPRQATTRSRSGSKRRRGGIDAGNDGRVRPLGDGFDRPEFDRRTVVSLQGMILSIKPARLGDLQSIAITLVRRPTSRQKLRLNMRRRSGRNPWPPRKFFSCVQGCGNAANLGPLRFDPFRRRD